MWGN